MNDLEFPSGPWIGFYVYGSARQNRHRMDLGLNFGNGAITGEGSDDLGKFIIRGGFDGRSGECYWNKVYIGAHTVFYKGFREGKGIWGTWEITFEYGGFHIWPLAHGTNLDDADGEKLSQPAPVENMEPVLIPMRTTERQTLP